jgi:hypothetical protein
VVREPVRLEQLQRRLRGSGIRVMTVEKESGNA